MLKSWLIHSLAFWLTSQFLRGFTVKGFWGALKVAAVFGILNFFLGKFLLIWLGVASFGLGFVFLFVTRTLVNAILLKLTDAVTDSIEIKGLMPAIVGALSISAIATFAEYLLKHQGQLNWI